eukprot:3561788-Prymnesium_polylepis.1
MGVTRALRSPTRAHARAHAHAHTARPTPDTHTPRRHPWHSRDVLSGSRFGVYQNTPRASGLPASICSPALARSAVGLG